VIADPPNPDSADEDASLTALGPISDPPLSPRKSAPASGPDQAGTTIGAYRLLRLLGSGGMGAVWLADRQDGQFSKQVALKLLHAGMADSDLRARFLQERQILASLQHPNIAALFDGGVSADGRPFFAMEYVDGRSITHYCDAEGLDVRDRVRLFLQVLRAVAHAHQRLIVHRDLKPSNVMVNSERVVKLLDFGIAKVLHSNHAVVTQFGDRAMTPRYAAPEQIRGEPVTVTTDVYALGVTFFEMLTGRTPYVSSAGRAHSVEQAILTLEPCKPGLSLSLSADTSDLDPTRESFERNVDKQRLRRELGGDLELIILKALRKETAQRYPSVEAFSADLERYLDGRPILARAPTWRYRAGKWLRRHALASALGTFSLLLLISGMFFLNAQRERASLAAARAEATQDFLIGLFEEAGPDQGGNVNASVRDILARGAARADLELAEQPALKQRLSGLIGRLMNDVGDYARAEPVLAGTVASLLKRPGNDHELLQARTQLAIALASQNKHAEAETQWQAVLDHAPADSTLRADAHSGFGALLANTSRFEAAQAQHELALAIWRKRVPGDEAGLANALIQSATTLDYADSQDEAGKQLAEAVGLLRRAPQASATQLGRALHQFGYSKWTLGELGPARAALQEAVDLLTASLGADHAATLNSRRMLGDVIDDLGDRDGAYALLKTVMADAERRYGNESRISAEIANSLASIDLVVGRYVDAEHGFRHVVRVLTAHLGQQHIETSTALANLSNALFEQGRWEESITTLQQSLASSAGSAGEDSSGHAMSLFALGRTQRAMGEYSAATASVQQAEQLLTSLFGEPHSQTLRARHLLAAIALDAAGDDTQVQSQALALLDHVDAHLETESRRGRRLRMDVLVERARISVSQANYDSAHSLLQEALAIGNSEFPDGGRSMCSTILELANVQLLQGDRRAARASLALAEASNSRRQSLFQRSRELQAKLSAALAD